MQLWDRETVDQLKSTAWVGTWFVVLEKNASPANGLQAATELGFPYFPHLSSGYPVYSKEERAV